MSNYDLTAPCGCKIITWDIEGHRYKTELEPCELHGAAEELLEACLKLLRTGLNGGNNVRLAFLAMSAHGLSSESLAQADESEHATELARAAIQKAEGRS